MFQLSKLDFLEFFIGGVGIKLLDTVYMKIVLLRHDFMVTFWDYFIYNKYMGI